MTKARLCIALPQIGLRSETFIRRHVLDLLPGETILAADWLAKPAHRAWEFPGPQLVLRPSHEPVSRAIGKLARKLAPRIWSDGSRLESFLGAQGCSTVMAEYVHTLLEPLAELRRRGKIRWFAHAHGFDLSALWRDEAMRERFKTYSEADGVIVVNEVMRDRLKSIGVGEDRIHLIPCGVDVEPTFTERPLRETVTVLAVGRLTPKKAPVKLLQAFETAHREEANLRLRLIGAGEMDAEVRAFVSERELTPWVDLLGPRSSAEVREEMLAADIFAQHSIVNPKSGDEEGFPVAIAEAMGRGLPVVSTRHTGIPAAVQEGVTGLLVEEGDVTEMAKALVELARSASTRTSFGEAGHRRAAAEFTWDVERQRLLQALF